MLFNSFNAKERNLKKIEKLVNKEQLDNASEFVEKLIESDPQEMDYYFKAADIYHHLRKYSKVCDVLKKFLRRSPKFKSDVIQKIKDLLYDAGNQSIFDYENLIWTLLISIKDFKELKKTIKTSNENNIDKGISFYTELINGGDKIFNQEAGYGRKEIAYHYVLAFLYAAQREYKEVFALFTKLSERASSEILYIIKELEELSSYYSSNELLFTLIELFVKRDMFSDAYKYFPKLIQQTEDFDKSIDDVLKEKNALATSDKYYLLLMQTKMKARLNEVQAAINLIDELLLLSSEKETKEYCADILYEIIRISDDKDKAYLKLSEIFFEEKNLSEYLKTIENLFGKEEYKAKLENWFELFSESLGEPEKRLFERQAEFYFSFTDYEKSVSYYKEIIKIEPFESDRILDIAKRKYNENQNIYFLDLISFIGVKHNDISLAEKYLIEGVKKEDDNLFAILFNTAKELFEEKQDSFIANYILSKKIFSDENYEEAFQYIKRSVIIYPKSLTDFFRDIDTIYEEVPNLHDEITAWYNKFEKLDLSGDVFFEIALNILKKNKPEIAFRLFWRALEKDVNIKKKLNNELLPYFQENKNNLSLEAKKEIANLFGKSGEYEVAGEIFAELYLDGKIDFKETFEMMKFFSSMLPESIDLQKNILMLYFNENLLVEAKEVAKKIMEKKTTADNKIFVLRYLTKINLREKKTDEALQIIGLLEKLKLEASDLVEFTQYAIEQKIYTLNSLKHHSSYLVDLGRWGDLNKVLQIFLKEFSQEMDFIKKNLALVIKNMPNFHEAKFTLLMINIKEKNYTETMKIIEALAKIQVEQGQMVPIFKEIERIWPDSVKNLEFYLDYLFKIYGDLNEILLVIKRILHHKKDSMGSLTDYFKKLLEMYSTNQMFIYENIIDIAVYYKKICILDEFSEKILESSFGVNWLNECYEKLKKIFNEISDNQEYLRIVFNMALFLANEKDIIFIANSLLKNSLLDLPDVLDKLEKYTQANKHFVTAEIMFFLASLYERTGEYLKAGKVYFEQFMSVDGDKEDILLKIKNLSEQYFSPEISNIYGNVLFFLGKYEESIEIFEALLIRDISKDILENVIAKLIDIYKKFSQDDKIKILFDNPKIKLIYSQGEIYKLLDSLFAQITNEKIAFLMNKTRLTKSEKMELVNLLVQQGEYEKAIIKVNEIFDNELDRFKMRGEIYLKSGLFLSALENFKKVLEKTSDKEIVYKKMYELYIKLGDYDKAALFELLLGKNVSVKEKSLGLLIGKI